MATLLRVDGLSKSFGERPLFSIERLQIAEGSAYALTGPNGSGKSTLLRVIAGLEPAHAAGFEFDGHRWPLVPYPKALRSQIVYVHQHPVLFSTNVRDNIAYGLVARGTPRSQARQSAEAAMEWAGITHLRDRPPQKLSGGERQRVALARAKVLEPRLLLLDEPTSNLDGAAREQVLALIPALHQTGASTIIACHDRELINMRGVRRLKLSDGRLEYRVPRNQASDTPSIHLAGGQA